jgi:hypothetical protein
MERIRRIAYIFVALFLLCHFLSFSPESGSNPLRSNDVSQSISIQIPNGIQLEVNTEKTTITQICDSLRGNTGEQFSNAVRMILFAVMILCLIYPYFLNGTVVGHAQTTNSQSYILRFIQCKDGKK